MLTYIKGDLFSSPAQVLVNTVNTVGIMGKGLALEFKTRYPEMFKEYQKVCNDNLLDIGKLFLWKKEDKWVLLFPTKKHWRSPSKLDYIEKGLEKFVQSYDELGIESIAFPKLGCGNGGLDWADVKPLMEKYLKHLPINIYIYLDNYKEAVSEHEQPLEIENWLSSNTNSIGFTTIKEKLKNIIDQNNELLINGSELESISWENDKVYLVNGNEVVLTEEQLFDFWNYVRDVGIIDLQRLPSRYSEYGKIMLDIFKKLNYVEPIIIVKHSEKQLQSINGFQYLDKQVNLYGDI